MASHSGPTLWPQRKRPLPAPSPAGWPPLDPALAARKLPNRRGPSINRTPSPVPTSIATADGRPHAEAAAGCSSSSSPWAPPPSVVPREEQKPLPLRSLKELLGIVGGIRKEQGGLHPFQAFHSPRQGQVDRTIAPVGRGYGEGQDLPRIQFQEQVELTPVDPLSPRTPPPTGFGVGGLGRQGGNVQAEHPPPSPTGFLHLGPAPKRLPGEVFASLAHRGPAGDAGQAQGLAQVGVPRSMRSTAQPIKTR